VLQVGGGGFARETSIKFSPYGVWLYDGQCFQAKLLSVLQVAGGGVEEEGGAWCLLMERCCGVVRGLLAKFDGVFYHTTKVFTLFSPQRQVGRVVSWV
jgi:hypothetical protein